MNRRERLEKAIGGGTPDRIPVSAWGHFYIQETNPETFAEAMLGFFNTFDWDFMKVHSRASYHVEGWGYAYEPSKDPKVGHTCTSQPIKNSCDWKKIRPLDLSEPPFREQIKALRLIKKRLPADVPVIMTVFSPLDIAEKLVDRNQELLRSHINNDPESLEVALDAFSDTFERFVRALVLEGVDGLYFSTKWANEGRLAAGQYERLGKPYDLRVLKAAQPLWCNFLHVCEDRIRLPVVADYPVSVFHWDRDAGNNPDYCEGKQLTGRASAGGVNAKELAFGTPAEVEKAAIRAITETNGKDFVLGPGCSALIGFTPDENFHALRHSTERI